MPRSLTLSMLVFTATAVQPVPAAVDFAHEIVPILRKNCVECHGGDKSKGGFSLNDRDLVLESDAVVPGDPENSLLVELLRSEDEDERMPPVKHSPDPLPEEQIAMIEKWIKEGLPWEPGFTFATQRYEAPLKPRRPALPPGPADANPIDLVINAWLEKNGIEAPAPLDDAAFFRRVSLDLVGLPPSPDELQRFLADTAADKRAKTVRALLARNTDYADHWLTFWNDLLRNAYDGTGFITGGRQRITGWLYGALHRNVPYDRFVRELVAPGPEARGFIDGIEWRGEVNASQTRAIQFSQNVSQVFLGINMKCASCHDSFIDRWKLRDAYSLAAIYSDKPLELNRCDKPTGEAAVAGWIFPEIGTVDPKAPRDQRLSQLADLMVHPENGRTTRTVVNRLWHRMMGKGIIDPVDAMDSEPWNADLLDLLANRLVDGGYDLKKVLELIATSRIYQSRSEVAREGLAKAPFRGPVMKRMSAEQFIDSVRSVTGAWPKPTKNGGKTPPTLVDIAKGQGLKEWDGRPLRAALTDLDSFQSALGRPNRDQVVSNRPDMVSTLEAVHLANGPEFAAMLREGAAALLAPKPAHDELIDRVYLAALSRPPATSERTVAREILGESPGAEAVADFLWTIFVQPEFFYLR